MLPQMATAIVGPTNYRYPDDAGTSAAVANYRAIAKVTPVPIPKPGSIPSLPPSADLAAAAARAANLNSTSSTAVTDALSGQVVLEPSDGRAALGAHTTPKDGRIRNPVPSKLKGKTDGSKGHFNVLHMGVTNRSEAVERDAQAKRTSESTELAAKRAYENGYVSLRRSRFVHIPDEEVANPFVPPKATVPSSGLSSRRRPLSAEETKTEQARLLTLLRSLHPVLVVDQICKALAFFGGIPGAPPPGDGTFPESLEANGSGSLFVGWVAEIFPKVVSGSHPARPDERRTSPPARQLAVVAEEPAKRKRGRPKGSKSCKERKVQGAKNGRTNKSTAAIVGQKPAGAGDESRVEAEKQGEGSVSADDVDANIMLLAYATSPKAATQTHMHGPAASLDVPIPPKSWEDASSTGPSSTLPAGDEGIGHKAQSGKRRGRPKGTKNRPKDAVRVEVASLHAEASQVPFQMSHCHQTANHNFTPVNTTDSAPAASASSAPVALPNKQIRSNGSARDISRNLSNCPDGKVTRAQANGGYRANLSGEPAATAPAPTGPYGDATSVTVTPLSQGSRGQLKPTASEIASPAPLRQTKAAAAKRERADAHRFEATAAESLLGENGSCISTPPVGYAVQSSLSRTLTAPPPKRQRKNREAKATASTSASRPTESLTTTTASDMVPILASPMPAPDPSPASVPIPVPISMPLLATLQSPQQGQFGSLSPAAMETYAAQLLSNDPHPAKSLARADAVTATAQARVDPRRFVVNRLQQRTGIQSPPQMHQQVSSSQPGSPVQAQQGARSSQSAYSPQYRQANPPFSQHLQTRRQTYVSAPRHNSLVTAQGPEGQHQYGTNTLPPQMQASQAAASQQHLPAPSQSLSQPQQVSASHSDSPYGSVQHHFVTAQQQLGTGQHPYPASTQQAGYNQRYPPQLVATSAGSTGSTYRSTYTASPHFSPVIQNGFNSPDINNYRGQTPAAYAQQRSQTTTPISANAYRTSGSHSLSHQSPSFTAVAGSTHAHASPLPRPTSATPALQLQGLDGTPTFSSNNPGDWSIFDATAGLDASSAAASNVMAAQLSTASYGLTPASSAAAVRRTTTTHGAAAGFAGASMGAFDAAGLDESDRYYNNGRR